MAIEDHPLHAAWNAVLDQLVETERRYYTALMERRSDAEAEVAARDLDAARERYRGIAGQIEEYEPPSS